MEDASLPGNAIGTVERYVAWSQRYRWAVVIVVPLTILLLSLSLKELAYEGGYRIWFAEGSELLEAYDDYKAVFGSDDVIVIAFEDRTGVFTQRSLDSIGRLTRQLEELAYVDEVRSLENLTYIRYDVDEKRGVVAALNELEDETQMRQAALSEPTIRGAFVNGDATVTMIAARVAKHAREGTDRSFEIRDAVQRIVDTEAKRSGYRFYLNGAIPLQTGFTDIMIRELALYMPLIAAAVGVLLFFIFRRISGVVVPMTVVGLSILCVLSAVVLSGYKLNNFTADLPVFVLAIGLAAAVHLYTTWQHRINEGDDTKQAVAYSLRKNLLALFLTSLTTAIGFASLAVSDIVPVYTLGLSTAGGVVMVFVLCLVLMPAMLLLVKPTRRAVRKRFLPTLGYGAFIVRHNRGIVVFTLLLFALFASGIARLQIDSNLIRFLDDDVEPRIATEFVMKKLTGPMGYEIVVDSGTEKGIVWPQFMREVATFSRAFTFAFDEVRHVASAADVVRRYYEAEHPERYRVHGIPDSPLTVAEYLERYEASGEGKDATNPSKRYLHIHAQTDITFSERDLEMMAWVERWWVGAGYSAKVYGQTSMFARMQSDITDTLLWSIGTSVLLVSLVMLAIFRRPGLLYVYLLPNLLPFVLVLGVMGWMRIPVDLGVAISGAVILGIAVDDTMHFLVKYFEGRKRGLEVEAALDYVMSHSGQAIMITTLILSSAFLMLTTSDFIPNAHFGIVTATALMIAVVTDLLLLPALLSLSDRRGRKPEA